MMITIKCEMALKGGFPYSRALGVKWLWLLITGRETFSFLTV